MTTTAAITSLLDLRLDPDALEEGFSVLEETLGATRARPGCLGADVTVDVADGSHVVVVERWASLADDDAYRAWRATPDGASQLARVVTAPPLLTRLAAR